MSEIKSHPYAEKMSVVELIIDGLRTDGAHHKQWYLEQILLKLGGEHRTDSIFYHQPWEKGIAP